MKQENTLHIVKTSVHQIKRIKQINSLKENQLFAFLISQRCNREQLSLQFCIGMTSQINLIRSCIENKKRLKLLCCRGRIEIKNFFSWLLQNKLLGVEMLFEIQKSRLKPRIFYIKQHFSTSDVILQQTQKHELNFLTNTM